MRNIPHISVHNPHVIRIGSTEIGMHYWVGHCDNGVEYFAGQTFKVPADGVLRRIRLFPTMVYGAASATLQVYEFNEATHTWHAQCGSTECAVTKAMEGHWIDFDLKELPVVKNSSYAFKISCNNGGMLAIAECPWQVANPYTEGEEWIGSSQQQDGAFHKDFDLAFEAEILTRA